MEVKKYCAPGEVLGEVSGYLSGGGTYVQDGVVRASLVGVVHVVEYEDKDKPVIEVVRAYDTAKSIVPKPGDVVIGRITKVNPRFANILILCVNDKPVPEPFPGMVKKQDVRQTLIAQVEMYKCFRPTDIVRAEVISLGDKRFFYLSTAKNEYGVIYAKSMAGATLIPINWNTMQCPTTKTMESRKVAKIDDDENTVQN